MKKIISSFVFLLIASNIAFAAIDFTGKLQFQVPVSNSTAGNLDYMTRKAELYLNSPVIYSEIDFPVINPATAGTVKIDQFYIKLLGGDLKVGLMETGLARMSYSSLTLPTGTLDKEIEGFGIYYEKQIGILAFRFINFGSIIASSAGAPANQVYLLGTTLGNKDKSVDFNVWSTTSPATSQRDMDFSVKVSQKIAALEINAIWRQSFERNISGVRNNIAAIASTLNLNPLKIYGSYGMGLEGTTFVGDVKGDLIAGVSMDLSKDVFISLEYKNTDVNYVRTVDQILLGIQAVF